MGSARGERGNDGWVLIGIRLGSGNVAGFGFNTRPPGVIVSEYGRFLDCGGSAVGKPTWAAVDGRLLVA